MSSVSESYYSETQDGEEESYDEDDEEESRIQIAPARVKVNHEGILDPSVLIRRDGYMFKKGGAVNARGGFRNWKKRWFVLEHVNFLGHEGFELQYFDKPGGKMKGKVGLSEIELFCENKSAHKKVKYEFQILLQNGGVLQLSCDDPEEREEWIETLNMVIAYLRKIVTASSMTLDGYDPMLEDDEESYNIGEEIGQNCQAFGPGLFGSVAGEDVQFVIQIHDSQGNQVRRGGMPVTATISNDSCLYYLIIQDNDDGTYQAHYTLAFQGKYQLAIKLNDEHHIMGSPFDIEIMPAKTSPAQSIAEGEALTGIRARDSASFDIISKDAFGNRKIRGGDPYEVGVMGPAQLVSLTDNTNGSYTCVIEASSAHDVSYVTASSLLLSVTLQGKHIIGSPFKPAILDPLPFGGVVGGNHSGSISGSASPNASSRAPSLNSTEYRGGLAASMSSQQRMGQGSSGGNLSSGPSTPQRGNSLNNNNNNNGNRNNGMVNTLNGPQVPGSDTKGPLSATDLSSSGGGGQSSPYRSTGFNPAPDLSSSGPMSRLQRARVNAIARSANRAHEASAVLSPHPTPQQYQQQYQQQQQQQQYSSSATAPYSPVNGSVPQRSPFGGVPSQTQQQQQAQGQVHVSTAGSSRLSQLASRSANALQNKRQQQLQASQQQHQQPLMDQSMQHNMDPFAPSSSDPLMSNDLPVPKLGESEVMSTLAELRQGLGGVSADVDASFAGKAPKLWDASHQAMRTPSVVSLLSAHFDALFNVFHSFSDTVEGILVMKWTTSGHSGALRMLELFDVVPSYVSRSEAKTMFTLMTNAQRVLERPAALTGGGMSLDFSGFIKYMVMLCLHALSKTGEFSSMYATVESKLEVMLFKWGLADTLKLQILKNNGTAHQR